MNFQSFPERAGRAARIFLNPTAGMPSLADRVEQMNGMTVAEAAQVLTSLPENKAIALLARPELHHAADIVAALPVEQAVKLLKGTAHDRVTDLFQAMDDATRRNVIFARLDPATARAVEHLMHYPQRTAGAMMTTEFVSVPENCTVADALAHIRKVEKASETIYAIYVLDRVHGNLLGVVTLRRLIWASLTPISCRLPAATAWSAPRR